MRNNGRFKVGQRVRLVDNRDKIAGRIAMGWGPSMEKYFGDIVTITEIGIDVDLDYIRTEENRWSWDLRFLEPVEERSVKYNMENLKVGQKVRLVATRPDGPVEGGFGYGMNHFLGKEVTITKLYKDFFCIKEDEESHHGGYVWDYRFIEESVEKPQSKVYRGWDFTDEDYILPCDYSLVKVIENGNAVICFVEQEDTDKTIKTVAICQEGDTFDLHKGVEICMYKTLRKIADKGLKRF